MILLACCINHDDSLSLLNSLIHMASSHVTWAWYNMAGYQTLGKEKVRQRTFELLVVKFCIKLFSARELLSDRHLANLMDFCDVTHNKYYHAMSH